jgi:hypothetical protein
MVWRRANPTVLARYQTSVDQLPTFCKLHCYEQQCFHIRTNLILVNMKGFLIQKLLLDCGYLFAHTNIYLFMGDIPVKIK